MKSILPCVETAHRSARILAKLAVRSLYFELQAYPKPGLVSFLDQGAHHDMDGQRFYRSLFSLRRYFYKIALQGFSNVSFDVMKATAITAEKKMMIATEGVNTHRGAIFSLGLVCVSSARLMKLKGSFTPLELYQQLKKDWKSTLQSHRGLPNSHGSQVSQKYRIVGAQGIAMLGYPIIFQLLDSFISLFRSSRSINICCLNAYLNLLIHIDDTNILYRKGLESLQYAKEQAKKILFIQCQKKQISEAILLHHLFSKKNISPGGVADLIAVLLFISQLFSEELQCHC